MSAVWARHVPPVWHFSKNKRRAQGAPFAHDPVWELLRAVRGRCAAPARAFEQAGHRIDHDRVPLGTPAGLQNIEGSARRDRAAIRPIADHGVEGVHDREDPRLERNVLTRKTIRITEPVPTLVMRAYRDAAARERRNLIENALAGGAVFAHDIPLLRAERPRLEKNLVRRPDLPDVVKRRAQFDELALFARQTHRGAQAPRPLRRRFGMRARYGIAFAEHRKYRGRRFVSGLFSGMRRLFMVECDDRGMDFDTQRLEERQQAALVDVQV